MPCLSRRYRKAAKSNEGGWDTRMVGKRKENLPMNWRDFKARHRERIAKRGFNVNNI
ncbi:MAG: hypothetical protein ACFNVO_08265 [Prevotella sp.]